MVNDLEKKRKEKKKKERLVERSFLFTMQCAHRGVASTSWSITRLHNTETKGTIPPWRGAFISPNNTKRKRLS